MKSYLSIGTSKKEGKTHCVTLYFVPLPRWTIIPQPKQ